jgi:hypothetical protein
MNDILHKSFTLKTEENLFCSNTLFSNAKYQFRLIL